MAKPAVAGRVKTRLIGGISALQAAAVHAAMLRCVLARVTMAFATRVDCRLILALDMALAGADWDWMGVMPQHGLDVRWLVMEQAQGHLGQRMLAVWRQVGGGRILFLGADSPDVPLAAVVGVLPALETADAVMGRVEDGGFWTVAAQRLTPTLFDRIDWGTGSVYHQTFAAAERAGLTLVEAPSWFDVDEPADLEKLRLRLNTCTESALVQLRMGLDRICEGERP